MKKKINSVKYRPLQLSVCVFVALKKRIEVCGGQRSFQGLIIFFIYMIDSHFYNFIISSSSHVINFCPWKFLYEEISS